MVAENEKITFISLHDGRLLVDKDFSSKAWMGTADPGPEPETGDRLQ
jgi:hypothetical protein